MTARARYRSPIGVLAVEASDRGVLGVSFGGAGPAQAGVSALARGHLDAALDALRAYFRGEPPDLPALDLRGSPFRLAVWRILVGIPWGEVRTYGQIAAELGLPGGARAVGAANHANPVAILVPCHRVVGARGALGGYGAGLAAKRWLLAHEVAHSPALRAP